MNLKFSGGEVAGGLFLTVGKIYEVQEVRDAYYSHAIFDDSFDEKSSILYDVPLWLSLDEIKKHFEILGVE